MLRRWLLTPEVARWWGAPAEQAALLEEDLDDPRMVMRIVSNEGCPFAYVQDYDVHTWEQPHFAHLPPGSRAVDAFIGEAGMIGRGHGARFLRVLAERFVAEGAPAVAIDPDSSNLQARRAYERAGFRGDAPIETRFGPVVLHDLRCSVGARSRVQAKTPLERAMTHENQDGGAHQGRIDIVSDAICPWCYIGKRQLERALPMLAGEGLRFSVHWNPFQLNPDMPREGVDRRSYRVAKFGSPERARELDARVTEAAAGVGLAFCLDLLERTPNTVDAHRLIWLAGQEGLQDAVMEAVFRAYFTEGRDIGDRRLLADCATSAGMARDAVLALLDGETYEAEVRAAVRTAREAGVNGVPSFFLDGYFLFSGALPAEQIAAALSRAHGVLAKQRTSQAA